MRSLLALALTLVCASLVLGAAPARAEGRSVASATPPSPAATASLPAASPPAAPTAPPTSPASSAASPAPTASPTSSATSLAETRATEGAAALDKGDFEAARLSFAQAYAVDPQHKYLFSLALAEDKSGHPLEALGHVRAYLAAPGVTEADRQQAAPILADAAAHVGHIRVDSPPGASISIDGAPAIATTPLPEALDVAPGQHTLDARAGAQTASTIVSPGPGETVVWAVRFDRPRGALLVPAPRTAVTAPTAAPPAPGAPRRKPPPSTRWLASLGFIAGGLVSAAVVGGFLAASANEDSKWSILNSATGYCPQSPSTPQCLELKRSADTRATDENIAIGVGVVGGALIVAGVAAFLVWPEPHLEKTRTSLVPWIGPGSGGALWTQSF